MSDSDQFTRESLEFTYELLRHSNPRLALEIRNLALASHSCVDESNEGDSNEENVLATIRVDFDGEKVHEIVKGLKESYAEISADDEQVERVRLVVQDWILLAQKQFIEGRAAFRSIH